LADAQQGDRVRRIGVLMGGDANDPVAKEVHLCVRLGTRWRKLTLFVWSGRTVQEVFVDPGDAVLHQCIRPLIGACAPGPHGHCFKDTPEKPPAGQMLTGMDERIMHGA
jgi:hypothetical protein